VHVETYSMADAKLRLDAFEDLLRASGLEIKRGSDLERLALGVIDLHEKHLRPELQDGSADIRAWMRETVGFNQLVALILAVKDTARFEQLVPHLHLLNAATTTQNAWAPCTDAASNKLFELVLACAAIRAGFGVELDHPERSTGRNPDVLVDVGEARPFGVACKTLHSNKPRTMLDNIEKGASQIEASPASRGIVALNLKNLFPHDDFFPILNVHEWAQGEEPQYAAWKSKDVLLEHTNLAADTVIGPLTGETEVDELQRILHQYPKVLPGVLFYVHTAAGVTVNGSPLPTNFGFLKLKLMDGPLDEADMTVLQRMNDGMQIA